MVGLYGGDQEVFGPVGEGVQQTVQYIHHMFVPAGIKGRRPEVEDKGC